MTCPTEFVLVPEQLFNFFYKEIREENHSKSDYIFNTIVGDNILFILDKTVKNIFYAYILDKNNMKLQIGFIFKYYKYEQFFADIKNFIKGKDFINFIIKREIYYNNGLNYISDKTNNNEILGEYLTFEKINPREIKKHNLKDVLNQNKLAYECYNKFINLLKPKDNKITLTNIKILIMKLRIKFKQSR